MADIIALRALARRLCRRLTHRASYPPALGGAVALLAVVLAGRTVGAVYLAAHLGRHGRPAVWFAATAAQLLVIGCLLPAMGAAGGYRIRSAVAGALQVSRSPYGGAFSGMLARRAVALRPFTAVVCAGLAGIVAPLFLYEPAVAVALLACAVGYASVTLTLLSWLLHRLRLGAPRCIHLEVLYLALATALYPSVGNQAGSPAVFAFAAAWPSMSWLSIGGLAIACLAVVALIPLVAWAIEIGVERVSTERFARRAPPVLRYYLRIVSRPAWGVVYSAAVVGAFIRGGTAAYRMVLAAGLTAAGISLVAFLARYEALLRDRWNLSAFSERRGALVLPAVAAHAALLAVAYIFHVAVRLR